MKEMSARARAVFQRTYSRQKADGSGHEDFTEAVDRVIGHQRWLWERAKGGPLVEDQLAELETLRSLILVRKIMPTGRTMWLGGTEISKTRELSQFACGALAVETVYDVVDFAWLLLNGCGVGALMRDGVLNGFTRPIKHISVIRSTRTEKGGEEHNTETWDPKTRTWTIRVGDSGEAWARAVGKLVAGKRPADRLVLDLSQIRPEGSMLSRYGWRSSGDAVISEEFPKIAGILNRRAGQLLRKMDIADVLNHLGVIQTGRRGAEILLIDADDPEAGAFARFKTGCWSDPDLAHRQQSNNTLLFWKKPTRRRLELQFETMLSSGGNEPGFMNAAAARARAPWFTAPNPCVEILLANHGFCNLFELAVYAFEYLEEMCEALRLVARANYRQTLVNLEDGVLQRVWHEINEHLRLCGVSGTGWAARPDLTPHDLKTMRIAAQTGAWSMADELGYPRPKNVTCVKPSGTVSKVMDAPGEGAHAPLGRYVLNSIVYARTDPLVDRLRAAGYQVRPHPTAETQVLVTFPVENRGVLFTMVDGVEVNLEPAVDQLERYRVLMEYWCDQNCSMTINYSPEEVPQVIDWLMQHWDSYVGLSFMLRLDPTKTAADLGASYLPQEVVSAETFITYVEGLRAVDWSGDLGGAVELDELDSSECGEGGVCPVR